MRVCEQIEEWIEEKIEKPIEQWTKQQEKRCSKWPWPLNLVCRLVVVLIKIVKWIINFVRTKSVRQFCRYIEIIVRFFFIYVRFLVNLAKDLLTRPWQTLKNVWEFIKSPFTRHCPTYRVSRPDSLLMISHHGAAKTFAENTVQAFRFALQNEGANAVEVDICMTQDGEIVAWHDWDPDDEVSLLRQMGRQPDNLYKPAVPGIGSEWRRPVISLRLDEFVQHYGYEKLDRDYHQPTPPVPAELAIPLLRDVMAELTQHANLQAVFLDVKMPDDSSGRAAEMLDHIHESIPRDRSFATVLLVPAKRVLQNMKKRDHQNNYQLPFSYDREFPAGIIFNVQDFSAIDSAFDMKNDVASVGRPTSATLLPWKTYTRLLGYDLPKWSKIRNTTGGWGAEGLVRWYIAWTFNDPGELECLCELGVSGIITDDVTRLRQIAHAKGRI